MPTKQPLEEQIPVFQEELIVTKKVKLKMS